MTQTSTRKSHSPGTIQACERVRRRRQLCIYLPTYTFLISYNRCVASITCLLEPRYVFKENDTQI